MDHRGEVVARAAPRPYGERWLEWKEEGVREPEYRYTGQEEDRVSGGVYMGARHYLPALGRWASVDPRIYEPGEWVGRPREANGYGYAQGNPVCRVDPSGMKSAGEVIEEEREWAEHQGEEVKATALRVVEVLWSVFGSEGLSRVADDVLNGRDDMTARDYVEAGADLAGGLGKIAKGAKLFRRVNKGEGVAEVGKRAGKGTAAAGGAPGIPGGGAGRGGTKLRPDSAADGSHSTFKRNADGQITGYAEWTPNPRNPSGFDQAKRVDTQYASPHTDRGVPTPHTHGKDIPGGVRPATPDELPK
jgi:RHS repeat-associated protein